MAGTQVPKGLAIGLAIVGIPIILWDAAATNKELEAVRAESNSEAGRIERCVGILAEEFPDASIRRPVCECTVKKAASRGANDTNGGYDEELLGPVLNECIRGDWD